MTRTTRFESIRFHYCLHPDPSSNPVRIPTQSPNPQLVSQSAVSQQSAVTLVRSPQFLQSQLGVLINLFPLNSSCPARAVVERLGECEKPVPLERQNQKSERRSLHSCRQKGLLLMRLAVNDQSARR